MKILKFHAERMHGYLTLSLDLRPDLTFLTGINGSGKTSAVRAITALLTPSISGLANMSYHAMGVVIEHEGQEIAIESKKTDEEIVISCSGIQGNLRIPLLKSVAYEPASRFQERQRDFYREQEALNNRDDTLVAIEKLPTPMFLDLERRHQEGTRIRRDIVNHVSRGVPVNPLAGSLMESLKDAETLAEQTYRQFLAIRAHLTDALKQEIILAAFRPVTDSHAFAAWLPQQSFLKEVEKDESVIPQSLLQIGISPKQIDETVQPFFKRVHEVANLLPSSEKEFEKIMLAPEKDKQKQAQENLIKNMNEWSGLQPQLKQINYLAERIARYNLQISNSFKAIQRYLTSVNGFLTDSSKRLVFDQSGNLRIAIDGDSKLRPISALSSGERQLVVILTHLAFNPQAKLANILIIDEPELSLHLRWQELFVDAVTSASPGLQLILATHSPSIIKGRLSDCIDVGEAHQSDRLLG